MFLSDKSTTKVNKKNIYPYLFGGEFKYNWI